VARRKHPNKDIEASIRYAERHGWRLEKPGNSAHAFGSLLCPHNDATCRNGLFCRTSIYGTPRNAENYAKQIKRRVDKCRHQALLPDEQHR